MANGQRKVLKYGFSLDCRDWSMFPQKESFTMRAKDHESSAIAAVDGFSRRRNLEQPPYMQMYVYTHIYIYIHTHAKIMVLLRAFIIIRPLIYVVYIDYPKKGPQFPSIYVYMSQTPNPKPLNPTPCSSTLNPEP